MLTKCSRLRFATSSGIPTRASSPPRTSGICLSSSWTGIFKTLKSQEKKAQEESLLDTRTPEDEILTAKIEIIKYIVNTKLEEAKQAERAKEAHDQKQKILGILAEKQDEDLRNKTPEELIAMLNQFG